MSPLAEAIRKLRIKNNVTQKEMASAIGMSPSYLSMVERGLKGKPPQQFFDKVIEYFELDEISAQNLLFEADISGNILRFPHNSKPDVFRLAHLFSKRASNLSNNEIARLISILAKENCKEEIVMKSID